VTERDKSRRKKREEKEESLPVKRIRGVT